MNNQILDSERIDMPIEDNDYNEAYERYQKQFTVEERFENLIEKLAEHYSDPFEHIVETLEVDTFSHECDQLLKEIYFTKPGE